MLATPGELKKEHKATTPTPFKLASEERHHKAQEELNKKVSQRAGGLTCGGLGCY